MKIYINGNIVNVTVRTANTNNKELPNVYRSDN